jgi:hypothetical protein
LLKSPPHDAKEALATAYAILVEAGEEVSLTQVVGFLDGAKEQIEKAWCGLDFDDETENIVQSADQSALERLQMEYLPFNPAFLKKVDELELSIRSSNCLKNDNIIYIGDLVQKSEAEMLRTPNFGRTTLNEIKEVLAQMGLHLYMEVPGWPPKNIETLAKRFQDIESAAPTPPVHVAQGRP